MVGKIKAADGLLSDHLGRSRSARCFTAGRYRAWSGLLFTGTYIFPASTRPARKGIICKSVDRSNEKTEAWHLDSRMKDSR